MLAKRAAPTDIDPSKSGGWLAYLRDPDGNWIEIYQHDPAKPIGDTIPEGY
jgi:hypothetical protein